MTGLVRSLFVAVALMLAACSEAPPDMKDPGAVARAFVSAYNARNLSAMLPLISNVNIEAVKAALTDGPDSDAYKVIFDPDVSARMAKENGEIVGPRYRKKDAVVRVADAGNDDVHVIVLEQRKDGDWIIEEFGTYTVMEFNELAEAPKT